MKRPFDFDVANCLGGERFDKPIVPLTMHLTLVRASSRLDIGDLTTLSIPMPSRPARWFAFDVDLIHRFTLMYDGIY